jgi:hypothetical protein
MSERVPLSFLLVEKGTTLEPVVPFAAFRDEVPCIVTAVLERTVAIHAVGDRYDTGAIKHDRILVDPDALEWQVSTEARASENGQTRLRRWNTGRGVREPKSQEELQAQRDKTDQEARANQARNARVAAAEVVRARALRSTELSKELKDLSDRATPFSNTEKARPAAGALHLVGALAPAGTQRVDVTFTVPEKLKHCKRCGEDKPRDQFAATGIYGGYCSTCEPLEKAERAAARDGKPKREKKADKIGRNVTRRTAKVAQSQEPVGPTGQPDSHARVLKLLERRDSLRSQLTQVIAELQEAVAGG